MRQSITEHCQVESSVPMALVWHSLKTVVAKHFLKCISDCWNHFQIQYIGQNAAHLFLGIFQVFLLYYLKQNKNKKQKASDGLKLVEKKNLHWIVNWHLHLTASETHISINRKQTRLFKALYTWLYKNMAVTVQPHHFFWSMWFILFFPFITALCCQWKHIHTAGICWFSVSHLQLHWTKKI